MKKSPWEMCKPFAWAVLCIALASCAKRVPAPATTDKETVVAKSDFVKLYLPQEAQAMAKRANARAPLLFPGDEISIGIYDKLPVSQEKHIEMKRIGDDGSIFILPVKEIYVGGLTVSQAEKTIEGKLSQYVVSPFCEVNIVKRAFEPRAYVFGEVAKSGSIPLKDGDRLLDAISSAGGCASSAYRRSIKVIRANEQNVSMISVDLYEILDGGRIDKNIALQDDDIIFVPRRIYTTFNEVMTVIAQLLPWYYYVKIFTP
jgi:protein involved in polysaccharide export with SLBB domain